MSAWPTHDGTMPTLAFDTAHGTKVTTIPDGVNTVVAAPITIAGHEKDLALTIAFAREDDGEIVEADVVINTAWSWAVLDDEGKSTSSDRMTPTLTTESLGNVASCASPAPTSSLCGGRFDLQAILTHEAGHFFGLTENYATSTSTMFFCSNPCEVHKRTPLDIDRASLAKVYPNPIPAAPTGAACDVARASSPRAGLVGGGLVIGVAFAIALRSRRGRRRTWVTFEMREAFA
jgi:hypothetical protein